MTHDRCMIIGGDDPYVFIVIFDRLGSADRWRRPRRRRVIAQHQDLSSGASESESLGIDCSCIMHHARAPTYSGAALSTGCLAVHHGIVRGLFPIRLNAEAGGMRFKLDTVKNRRSLLQHLKIGRNCP